MAPDRAPRSSGSDRVDAADPLWLAKQANGTYPLARKAFLAPRWLVCGATRDSVAAADGLGLGEVDHEVARDSSDHAAQRSSGTGGWYYDDDLDPQTIHLCPASCDLVSGDPHGKIDILFGCATKEPPPQ